MQKLRDYSDKENDSEAVSSNTPSKLNTLQAKVNDDNNKVSINQNDETVQLKLIDNEQLDESYKNNERRNLFLNDSEIYRTVKYNRLHSALMFKKDKNQQNNINHLSISSQSKKYYKI